MNSAPEILPADVPEDWKAYVPSIGTGRPELQFALERQGIPKTSFQDQRLVVDYGKWLGWQWVCLKSLWAVPWALKPRAVADCYLVAQPLDHHLGIARQ